MDLYCHLWNIKTTQSAETTKIVLLHGLGGTGAVWRPLAASLENDFTLLAPDQRGHGKSRPVSPSTSFLPMDYGQDLLETLSRLQFHPTFIVGHSMGVRSACTFARQKPSWTQGLVLVDLAFGTDPKQEEPSAFLKFLENLPMKFETRSSARNYLNQKAPEPSIAQFLLAVSLRVPDSSEITFPFDKEALLQTVRSASQIPLRQWVEEIASQDIPILVLRGEKSHVFTRENFEFEKNHFSKFPSIQFEEFQSASHGLPFEKRLEFVERLKQFIAETLAGSKTP